MGEAAKVIIKVSSVKLDPTWLTSVSLNGNALTQLDDSGKPAIAASTTGSWLFSGIWIEVITY